MKACSNTPRGPIGCCVTCTTWHRLIPPPDAAFGHLSPQLTGQDPGIAATPSPTRRGSRVRSGSRRSETPGRAQAIAAQAVRQALGRRRLWWAWVAACISALFQCQICSAAVGLPEPIGRTETSLARALPIMPLSHRESDCGRVMPRTSPMRVSSRLSLAAPPRLLKPASSAYVYATKPSVGTR